MYNTHIIQWLNPYNLPNTLLITIDIFFAWKQQRSRHGTPLNCRKTIPCLYDSRPGLRVSVFGARSGWKAKGEMQLGDRSILDGPTLLSFCTRFKFRSFWGKTGGREEGSGRWDLIVYTKWINPPTLRKITATAGLG